MNEHRRRVAVIGSGVSGLTAAYVLRDSHEVTLYEADDRLGGHADTHDVDDPQAGPLAVDTGFIVHNERTYPTLLRLFAELGVRTQSTDMSLSVRCDGCGLEYSGGQGAGGILAQNGSLLRPRFVRMLVEITRFHRQASRLLAQDPADHTAFKIASSARESRDSWNFRGRNWRSSSQAAAEKRTTDEKQTTAEFLRAGDYSAYFVAHFITPLIAAVWSCGPRTALQYPARYLFAFLDQHGLLSVGGSPQWRTVVGGSRGYVQRAVKELSAVRTGTPIRAITRRPGGSGLAAVEVRDSADRISEFDAVLVATHPDQALALLADPTPAERDVLGAFTYTSNPAVLHTDASVLPDSARARASWNYRMPSCAGGAEQVQVSYDMTRLQRLPTEQRYLVSLNPSADLRPGRVLARMDYAHPQFTPASVAAQQRLPGLSNGVTAFAGAYHGWGFHEDGARSGLAAAISLGGAW